MVELLSKRELARRLNVDESAVRRAGREGKLSDCMNTAGKIDWKKAQKNAWVQQNKVVKAKAGVSRAKAIEKNDAAAVKKAKSQKPADKLKEQKPEEKNIIPPASTQEEDADEEDLLSAIKITKTTTVVEAMRLREVLGALMDKKKLQEMEGTLVKRSEVERNLFAFGNQLKKSLMTFPENVIDDVLAAPNKVEAMNIMKLRMNQLLTLYANADNWKVTNAGN